MAEIKELKNVRRNKKRKKFIKKLLTFFAMCVGIVLVFYISVLANKIDIKAWVLSEMSAITTKSTGFPIDLETDNSKGFVKAGSDMLVLTESNARLVTKSGKNVVNLQHGFQNPQVKAISGKFLIYDRGTNHISMQSKTGTVYEVATENPIISAAISQKGRAAIITEAQMYASQMIVVDKKGNELFKWNSDGKAAVSASFSYDENMIATATIGAENGDMSTTVYLISFDKNTGEANEDKAIDFKSTMPLSVAYKKDGRLSVIGDNMAVNIDEQGNATDAYRFGDQNLQFIDETADNATVLCFGDYDHFQNTVIMVVFDSYNNAVKISLDVKIKSAKVYGDKIYVLTDDAIKVYNKSGTLIESNAIGDEIKDILPFGGEIFMLTPSQLRKF
ncbi:MAG: hypothetical protein IJC83_03320 [Oscillospiraceae bacterium]|nr:hypothetical protein [Oscillospiraceae bacterium]